MVSKQYRERIARLAPTIEYFRSLPREQQETLAPIIYRGALTVLRLLDLLEEGSSYDSIAKDLDLSLNTVKELTKALEEGGLFVQTSNLRKNRTGRPINWKKYFH